MAIIIVDVLFILFETNKIQKLCCKRTERFEVTTSSSAASNKICIRYNMKVLNFHKIEKHLGAPDAPTYPALNALLNKYVLNSHIIKNTNHFELLMALRPKLFL